MKDKMQNVPDNSRDDLFQVTVIGKRFILSKGKGSEYTRISSSGFMGVTRKDGDGPVLAFERAGDPLHPTISQNTKERGNFSTSK